MPKHQHKLTAIAAAIGAVFAPQAHAATAGQVEFATAGVNAVGPNGQSRPLGKGAEIQPGEIIDTGSGRAQLRFTDGGYVSLQPQTQFRIESYGYDKDDAKKNSIVMNLLKGGLRTITGLIGKTNREGYKLQTATATVGIRGTEFSITGFPDGSVLFHVADGAIDVSNGAGSSTLAGGQSASISSPNSSPTKTDDKPFLPPTVSGSQLQVAPTTNAVQDSTPIVPAVTLLTGTFTGQWRTASTNIGLDSPSWYAGTLPSFTLSPSGNLVAYGYAGNGNNRSVTIGAAGSQSYGNDGVMAWGRWIGGPVSDPAFGNPTYSAGGSELHYVVGVPVGNIPTSGIGTFSLYGGTAPSCSGNSCSGGISITSSLSIDFANYTGLFNMTLNNAADGVGLATKAGGIPLSVSNTNGVNFFGGANYAGGNTGTLIQTAGNTTQPIQSANLFTTGFLAGVGTGPGTGATHAGAVYQVNYSTFEGSNANIAGALVLKRGDIVPGTIAGQGNLGNVKN